MENYKIFSYALQRQAINTLRLSILLSHYSCRKQREIMKKTILALIAASIGGAAFATEREYSYVENDKVILAKHPFSIYSKNRTEKKSLFTVYLNPFFIHEFYTGDNDESKPKAKNNSKYNRPYVEAFSILTRDHGIDSYDLKGNTVTSISAYLSKNQINSLKYDERVSTLREEEEKQESPASYSHNNAPKSEQKNSFAKLNSNPGWHLDFTNARINNSTSNSIYLIEAYDKYTGVPINPSTAAQLNYVEGQEIPSWHLGDGFEGGYHFGHVAGVIGARDNFNGFTGVNPGQRIRYYPIIISDNNIASALEKAMEDAEFLGEFAVLSVSMNRGEGVPGTPWSYDGEIGNKVRQASNRLLIVQSAGNYNSTDCGYMFSPKNAYDGVLTVGGVDNTGARMLSGINYMTRIPSQAVSGSNYGSCVEVWAPAKDITSLDYYDGGTRLSSGTSYAAPITAAIASRYGTNSSTRPVTREDKIYQNLNPGNLVKHGSLPSMMEYLPLSRVEKNNNAIDIPKLRNGRYYGVAELDVLNNSTNFSLKATLSAPTAPIVRAVRISLTTSQSASSQTPINFNVYGKTDAGVTSLIASKTMSKQQGVTIPVLIPIDFDKHGAYRSITVEASNASAKLGASEFELYGSIN